jgi:hypothetical protein
MRITLQQRLAKLSGLVQLLPSEIDELQRAIPSLPEEYLRFLRVVGYGTLGDLQLYSGPVWSGSIYPERKADLSHIALFGDDFQGYCFGFDTCQGFSVVEVDPRGSVGWRSERTFLSLIETYVPA